MYILYNEKKVNSRNTESVIQSNLFTSRKSLKQSPKRTPIQSLHDIRSSSKTILIKAYALICILYIVVLRYPFEPFFTDVFTANNKKMRKVVFVSDYRLKIKANILDSFKILELA